MAANFGISPRVPRDIQTAEKEAMSRPSRTLAIIDLFTLEQPTWSIEDMMAALGYARPTTYRYVKQLVDAGLLQKTGAGRYALGARFIQLDYQIRRSDPVLLASMPIMAELTRELGVSVLLSEMYGHQLINIHHAGGPEDALPFPHSRGRPRPLFRGAAPKVMMAFLPRPALVRLYEACAAEIAANGMGRDWTEFRKQLSAVRKHRFYLSVDEVEPNVAGAAVPVMNDEGEVVATLSVAGATPDLERIGIDRIKSALTHGAARIQARLVEFLAAGRG